MSEVSVIVPKDKLLNYATTQVRVFDSTRKVVLGSALHDRSLVDYQAGGDIIRGKPFVDVSEGEGKVGLDSYISDAMLDGLEYPVLEVVL